MPATRRAAKAAPGAEPTRSRSTRPRATKPVGAAVENALGKSPNPEPAAPLTMLASEDTAPVTSLIPPAPAHRAQGTEGARTSLAKGGVTAKANKAGKTTIAARPAGGNGAKVKKPKLVRDRFTIPKPEYGVIEELKLRAAKLGQPAKKSEVLRAGVKALVAMSDDALLAVLAAVPRVQTDRPAKA